MVDGKSTSIINYKELNTKVRLEIMRIGDDLRARHPWLAAKQDTIGMSIMLVSVVGVVLSGLGYLNGILPAWASIVISAFFLSLLHELEHDLIHSLYFRTKPRVQDFMFLVVWMMRPNVYNPWIRRKLHLHHHIYSGTDSDLEEFGITNGMPWGIRRLFALTDGLLATVLNAKNQYRVARNFVFVKEPEDAKARKKLRRQLIGGFFPFGNLFYFPLWHLFVISLLVRGYGMAFDTTVFSASTMGYVHLLDQLAVVFLLPNFLRSFAIQAVSSNIHYFGDVEKGNIIQQTQVFTKWWAWPLQAFCFNFGGTHAIHHFVVRDPFYIRQWIAKPAMEIMQANGVRFNDVESMTRANRWDPEPSSALADDSHVVTS